MSFGKCLSRVLVCLLALTKVNSDVMLGMESISRGYNDINGVMNCLKKHHINFDIYPPVMNVMRNFQIYGEVLPTLLNEERKEKIEDILNNHTKRDIEKRWKRCNINVEKKSKMKSLIWDEKYRLYTDIGYLLFVISDNDGLSISLESYLNDQESGDYTLDSKYMLAGLSSENKNSYQPTTNRNAQNEITNLLYSNPDLSTDKARLDFRGRILNVLESHYNINNWDCKNTNEQEFYDFNELYSAKIGKKTINVTVISEGTHSLCNIHVG